MKYGFIYETTNLYNGMKYIGQHKRTQDLTDPDDSWYLGSGKLLCRSIELTMESLGENWRSNYSRIILCECDSAEELNEMEEYYLNLVDAAKNPLYYNISNKGREGYPVHKGMTLPEYRRDKLSDAQKKRVEDKSYINPAKLPGVGDKISSSLKAGYASGRIRRLTGSDNPSSRQEVKDKISASTREAMARPEVREKYLASRIRLSQDEEFRKKLSESRIGDKNPCYGKIWINNGEYNRRVTKEIFESEFISQGFVEGRLCKPYGERKSL